MNFDVNLGSRSLITLEGSPNRGNICRRNRLATSSALIVSLQGMATIILVQSWSVMVRIESHPPDSGSLTMKSIAIVWNGSASATGVIGYNGAFLVWVLTL